MEVACICFFVYFWSFVRLISWLGMEHSLEGKFLCIPCKLDFRYVPDVIVSYVNSNKRLARACSITDSNHLVRYMSAFVAFSVVNRDNIATFRTFVSAFLDL